MAYGFRNVSAVVKCPMALSKFCTLSRKELGFLRKPWRCDSLRRVQRLAITTSVYTSASAPKIDGDRLWADIHHTCQFGLGERWGKYVIVSNVLFLPVIPGKAYQKHGTSARSVQAEMILG